MYCLKFQIGIIFFFFFLNVVLFIINLLTEKYSNLFAFRGLAQLNHNKKMIILCLIGGSQLFLLLVYKLYFFKHFYHYREEGLPTVGSTSLYTSKLNLDSILSGSAHNKEIVHNNN